MVEDAAAELLQQFCRDLRLLWEQAGGPSLRVLSGRVGLGKSQVGAILGGEVRRMPDWAVVRALVRSFHEYARAHHRMHYVTVGVGVADFWRPRYAAVDSTLRLAGQRGRSAGGPGTQGQPAGDAAPSARAVPRELPMAVRCFTGRSAELSALSAVLSEPGEPAGGRVLIAAVSGTAGAGKTALAIEWAHRAASRFPDGQLYVDLRGYDPDQPMNAADVLARFLGALGVPDPDLPPDVDGRATRFRTATAGRRMLIVLDNASTVDQVRPLLPGTAAAAVLVTSRDSLAGLIARDGAHRINLEVLPPADAHTLLRRLIGPRADAEPGAVATFAERCARLPLALRNAAELATSTPAITLTELGNELADRQRRLELLDAGGDPRTAISAVFSWSVRRLPAGAAHTFRLLGLYSGADFDAHDTAALVNSDLSTARRNLDVLARAHLIHPTANGRHGMHDLLRAYAASLAR
jgi:NB-ARC domain